MTDTTKDELAQPLTREALREKIADDYHKMMKRPIFPPLLDAIMASVDARVAEVRKEAAKDIFGLAHQYAQEDKTMIGSEELRAYHYYSAIHKIGEFDDR